MIVDDNDFNIFTLQEILNIKFGLDSIAVNFFNFIFL
jgi:hypothetical protein